MHYIAEIAKAGMMK